VLDSSTTDNDETSRGSVKQKDLDMEDSLRCSVEETDEDEGYDDVSPVSGCHERHLIPRHASQSAYSPARHNAAPLSRAGPPCPTPGDGPCHLLVRRGLRLQLVHSALGPGEGRRTCLGAGARGPGPSYGLQVEGAQAVAPGARAHRRLTCTRHGLCNTA